MGWYTTSAVTVVKDTVRHSSANYHPSLWGDHFLSFSSDSLIVNAWEKEAEILKFKVREKLMKLFETPGGLEEQLNLIDTIQRLGIAYHFEEEIEKSLNQIFNNNVLQEVDDDDDNLLGISALWFRLLREHGFHASSDVFNKFKDGQNSFKEARDVQGLLSLYEAAYLRVHGEDILDEALDFTKTKLYEMIPHLKPSLANQVLHALSRPIRKALPRVYAREFMAFYEEDEFHDKLLLKFAKLDFNILQKQHQEELSVISRWWSKLQVPVNFPFARDRIVECYFWILGVYYEPKYALARKFLTKVIAMASIVDDIFDNIYGINAELEIYTQAVQRWDIDSMDKLPEFMKIWFQAVLQIFNEMEEDLSPIGRSFAVRYAKDAMINAVRYYHEESKWLVEYQTNRVRPTMKEYMHTAFGSTGYQLLAITSVVGILGEIATEKVFQWLIDTPQMLHAACLIARFMDDIVSYQFEQQREHVPSAVECYMHEEGVSEEEACKELNKHVENAWNDLNQAFLDPHHHNYHPMPILTRILNLARVMDLLYKEEDGYTNPTSIKCHLVSLLVNPLQI